MSQVKVQAKEVTYELHSLGWKAFQDLCITVISEVFGQTVQSFFDSHDGGRDGAFHGTWTNESGESFEGTFTVQCKFTGKQDKTLTLKDLKDELEKAKRLASKGLANNYLLFTNARLTGISEEKIKKAFESISGVKLFKAYGCERISQIIHESARLRMLVPRIYGLGDLSQILDERAYQQTREILSSLGDDFSKFVITDAYKKSADALIQHGFVLLLGEPACGKSTIAAALAMGALDNWKCSVIKIRNANDFNTHWNPHESKQFFWVDDAFGATQIDFSKAIDWSDMFPHVKSAIKKGAKVVFTSRDYIYKAAKDNLKISVLPVIEESKVVINVQNITLQEREQILYNHMKLGTQPKKFKEKIKPFLSKAANNSQLSPETSRRLGDPFFTKKLHISDWGLSDYITKPKELLLDVIKAIDKESRSAIALVFMRGGSLNSPIEPTPEENKALSFIGGSGDGIRTAIKSLDESLLKREIENGNHIIRFKHPTIHDAFASFVAEDLELIDIYLNSWALDKLFNEVSCGDVGIQGVKLIVPVNRYDTLISRIKSFNTLSWHNNYLLKNFLSLRCDAKFLKLFVDNNPQFIQQIKISSPLYSSDIDIVIRLFKFNLLPELERLRVVNSISELAVNTPDSDWLASKIKDLMTASEIENINERIETELIPNLDEKIAEWQDEYNQESSYFIKDEPEEHFDKLKNTLEEYRVEFEESDEITEKIDNALEKIDILIEELESELPEKEDEKKFFDDKKEEPKNNERSIFDDVDV